jgi:hypothetical protein
MAARACATSRRPPLKLAHFVEDREGPRIERGAGRVHADRVVDSR